MEFVIDKIGNSYSDTSGAEDGQRTSDDDEKKVDMPSDPTSEASSVDSIQMKNRYYIDPKDAIICFHCRQKGHMKSECPKAPPCPVCGKRDHAQCSLLSCFNCFRVGHHKNECPYPKYKSFCKRCDMDGHSEYTCPDIWRQYIWTSEASSGRGTDHLVAYCFNCAASDHCGDDCGRTKPSASKTADMYSFSCQATDDFLRYIKYKGILLKKTNSYHYSSDSDADEYKKYDNDQKEKRQKVDNGLPNYNLPRTQMPQPQFYQYPPATPQYMYNPVPYANPYQPFRPHYNMYQAPIPPTFVFHQNQVDTYTNQDYSNNEFMHQQPEHTQQLLQQIVLAETGLDEQLGTTIKAFFKLQKPEMLVDQLGTIVQKKEQEIEKVCHAHYQDFVHSVDQLLLVRSDTQKLKKQLQEFNDEYQTICSSFLDKKKELAEYRRIYLNIEKAKETVKTCLFVLELVRKMNYLIDEKMYYSALKTLEELYNYHLRYLDKFDFVSLLRIIHIFIIEIIIALEESIPNIQQSVKSAVLSQLKEWFVSIRDWSRIVGELALKKTQRNESKDGIVGEIHDNIRKLSRSQSILAGTRKPSKQSLQSLSWKSLEQALNEDDEVDLFSNDRVQVDFRPLYQCIHIHEVLGIRFSLKSMYEENRRLQANLVLTTPFSLNENDLSGFEKYLYDIVGFFVVESHVVSTTDNFRSRASIELLWEVATDKLKEVIASSLQNCENPDHFLKIKELMINFIKTMENYNFAVGKLLSLLMTFFESYSNLKMLVASQKCDKNIEDDDGSPVTVHGITEYQEVLKAFSYADNSPKDSKIIFPKSFTFSTSFIANCKEIKQFINGFYQFAEGFHQQFNEMDDILKKTVEILLTQRICVSIENRLGTSNIKLSEVVCFILNLENYQKFVMEIEGIITQKRASQRLVSPKNADLKTHQNHQLNATLTINCQKRLQETRKNAENRIFELVNRKIDDFLDLAEYDFCPLDVHRSGSPTKDLPPNSTKDATPYLYDLVSFLDVVWTSTLADLPVTVKSFVYYDAIFHIVSKLLGMITAQNVKKLSPVFIDRQFSTDVAFLESFVNKLGDPNLIDHLVEIRQTLNLIRSETNLEEYLQVSVRNKKYSRVSKVNALTLLEKIRESGFWSDGSSLMSALGMSTVNPKDVRATKRRQLDTTIKALRDEINKNPQLAHELQFPSFDNWKWSEDDYLVFLEYMFNDLGLVKEFRMDEATLKRFLIKVRLYYNPNPFHNFHHCFCVSQMMYSLIKVNQLDTILDKIYLLILIFSAICHDLDHPGLNNSFQINSHTDLAILTNDSSPLENHHCSMAFALLKEEDLNILGNSKQHFSQFRKGVIALILATDLVKQGEILKKVQDIGNSFDYNNPQHRETMMLLLMKAADVSVETRTQENSSKWVQLLFEEFFHQGDLEKALGFPVAAQMDRTVVNIPKAQIGFIKHVLLPIYESLVHILPKSQIYMDAIQKSLEYYENLQ